MLISANSSCLGANSNELSLWTSTLLAAGRIGFCAWKLNRHDPRPKPGLFAAGTFFFAIVAVVYGVWSEEPAGTTALALTGGLAALVGFYVLFTARHIDPRPEDSKDAEIADGAGELGFYSPHSWWPLPCAFSAAIVATGLIFGWWLVAVGVVCLLLSVVGMVFEYYRGAHSH